MESGGAPSEDAGIIAGSTVSTSRLSDGALRPRVLALGQARHTVYRNSNLIPGANVLLKCKNSDGFPAFSGDRTVSSRPCLGVK
ncbi:hypothetical protein EYF80_061771 [Liparis tanakae]|uniref:Uncharacterized protein n=1 Tax=Liparis tanakae TaxID=230148 RepID=A0A4Z2EHC6_9TELE|nr:hypothetical protein EYF80_061771 [Liparis tanakae]